MIQKNLQPTFAICLNALWQEEEESLATSAALYSLLCCTEDACKIFVKKLLSYEGNQADRTNLRTAFRTLLSHTFGKRFERSERRNFHERLKQFLTAVEGVLIAE
ncbi:unnamed protein product [Onchocerca flexuosa]|uniref:Importin N-terminal domain-containing protein n=1 Tax=Onchocerca flexuosa TaxID=387005 RepID=A0A183HEN1_9BILA|nr:unnamed protein product [Onchocerca flexuosa]